MFVFLFIQENKMIFSRAPLMTYYFFDLQFVKAIQKMQNPSIFYILRNV